MDLKLWEKCVGFHGHECPGLAIGFRACEIAKEQIGLEFSSDEELVCVTENDACGVDAVQVITGCTLGKGNLLFRETGKMAFSFFKRKTGEKIRLVLKRLDIEMSREEKQRYILEAPFEKVFTIKKPEFDMPEYARIFKSIECKECKEYASENKIRIKDGKEVCMDCFEEYSRRM